VERRKEGRALRGKRIEDAQSALGKRRRGRGAEFLGLEQPGERVGEIQGDAPVALATSPEASSASRSAGW
jgi:hypothetical protein